MLRFKAYILLFVFTATTVSSFASVHECNGEITDIEFLSVAECEHETEGHSAHHESHCNETTCSDSEGHSDEHDCCSTSVLYSQQTEVVSQSEGKVEVESLIILKSIFLDVYEQEELSVENESEYEFRPYIVDFLSLFQTYLI